MGSSAFPFIDQGEDLVHTREKERKEKRKEKNREEESPKGCVSLLPPQAGPVGPVATSCRVPATGGRHHLVVACIPSPVHGMVNSSP